MERGELRRKAETLGLKDEDIFNSSNAELIRKIQRKEGNFGCFGTALNYCDQSQCCFREDCLNPLRIMVVDDEPNMCFLYEEELEELGYLVEVAKNGWEALEKLPKFKPCLITLDIKMPGMDGLETLKRIRETEKFLPIIICSAYGEYKQGFATWASDAYVVKGANLNELKSLIRKFTAFTPNHRNPRDIEISRLRMGISNLVERNKFLEKQLEQLSKYQEGKVANQNTDQYRSILGTTAHSLKGEFMHIGHSINILRKLAENSPDVQEECNMIERSIHYSEISLQRILDYLDLGKPSSAPVDILEVLKKAESLIRPRLASNIRLTVTIVLKERDHLSSITANVEQLLEVLLELINNAKNALLQKGGLIELRVEQGDDQIVISVKDNGPGIPKEFMEHLFQNQVSSKSGSGLGLFLCKKVISTLGGSLILQDSSDEGTEFRILLPISGDNTKEH